MSSINNLKQKFSILLTMVLFACTTVHAQTTQPTWWYGLSGAANFNFYTGTTQVLSNGLIAPTAFHKGNGVRPYGSILLEYRPKSVVGLMLNVAYDGRGGKFKDVVAPCNCPATLSTNTSYVAIEPSIRLGIPQSGLYFFAGPRVAFNVSKSYAYTQLKQPDANGDLSDMRKSLLSGQVGVGYDIMTTSPASSTQMSISPFVSFHPYFGQDPRSIESWSVTTVRAGIALKFGKSKKTISEVTITPAYRDFLFTVQAPKNIPVKREVSETLPLRNSVFFDEGSTQISPRYVTLTTANAAAFKETKLQTASEESMRGRSARQLNVYHNILNILGDRLRSNPSAVITLTGASLRGPAEGEMLAQSVKQYLVTAYAIDGSRIAVVGRTKPLISSEQPGGSKELLLLREGDRRVDITSASPELLMEVGGGMMKPVNFTTIQPDPLDSRVVLTVDSAQQLLKSWSVDVADNAGTVQHYGPYTRNQESIPGSAILGNNTQGDYKVVMTGETRKGQPIRKESTVHLTRQTETIGKALRYSILYDFDSSNSTASYDKFLTNVVAPAIADGSTVIIHGHTDVIGEEEYNMKLSQQRANDVQTTLSRALTAAGKNNVKFETLGFGEDTSHAPFENTVPEERFYNRTVIIDIIPVK
ncbi:OmpA family protein [Inquilinus sp. KBS0705]|nr:OmpA family protein [Inquilinus sp. KBS0705]